MKKIIRNLIVFFTVSLICCIVPMFVKGARVDHHQGMIVERSPMLRAYNDSNLLYKCSHYILGHDWYNAYIYYSNSVYVEYPKTVEDTVDKNSSCFRKYFDKSDFLKYADSTAGGYFNDNWNSDKWYNSDTAPTEVHYTDEKPYDNDSRCYTSINAGFYATQLNDSNVAKVISYKGVKVIEPLYIPDNGRIYNDWYDEIDANWTWQRIDDPTIPRYLLLQGKNTIYFCGSDSAINYTLGQRDLWYDSKNPVCSYNFNPKSGIIEVSADDDKSSGESCYSGLNYFKYRVSSDDGNTWSSWSSNCTETQNYTLKDPGNYLLETYAVDNADNSADSVFTGIVKIAPPLADAISNTYRTDIDVISSITLKNTSNSDILPTDNYTVKFDLPGITTQTKPFIVPGQKNTTVWFKWHTPTTSGKLTGTYTINSGGIETKCNAAFDILKLTENTPPDPKGSDTMPSTFSLVSPSGSAVSSLSWTDFSYENNAFKQNDHTASLVTTLSATPDSNCPTGFRTADGFYSMKSGYGINEKLTSTVYTDCAEAVTPCQNIIGMYPEFQYNNFYRVFEKLSTGTFQLKPNRFSMYNSLTHFTPVWWKDGTDYLPQTYSLDAWTPAGMLTSYSTDTLHIQGSVYDDWHVWPKN